MIIRNGTGQTRSLVVEDGESFTLSVSKARELDIPCINLRPRNTLALLAMTGRRLDDVSRLGDREFFEEVERTEDLVNAIVPDREGTIGGYSVGYLRAVLDALDPADSVPPRSVKFAIPMGGGDKGCGCHPHFASVPQSAHREQLHRATSTIDLTTHGLSEVYVPKMFRALEVFGVAVRLADIVVGHNATLFLDADFAYGIFNNVFAYRGSRIVQRSPYTMLDVRSTMRGGILRVFHSVTDLVKLDLHALAAEPAYKP